MKKSVDIIGLPIISISEGKELGTVKELLINHTNGTVAALVVDDSKWYMGAKLLPFPAVTGLGEYAVTIDSSNDILSVTDRPEFEQFLAASIKVIGTKVLTKNGRIQGKVTELIIDETGAIESCEVEKVDDEIVEIPSYRIVTFGKEVLIITEEDEPAVMRTQTSAREQSALSIPPVQEEVIVQTVPPTLPEQYETEIVTAVQPNETNFSETDIAAQAEESFPAVSTSGTTEEFPAEETELQPVQEDSTQKIDDKHRKYLLGKKASRRIETDNGLLIVEQDGEITEEVLQKAKLAGKFVELSMSIQ